MQLAMFEQPSVKTPLNYFGSKIRATHVLFRYIPPGLREMVSPFFGSGAFELALTGRGIRVHGYDKFPPIAHFWNVMMARPDALADAVRASVSAVHPDKLHKWAVARYPTLACDVERAALIPIIYNVSFNGWGFRGGGRLNMFVDDAGKIYHRKSDGTTVSLIHFHRIEGFHNPLLSVGEADFRKSLARHRDIFCYADPPYPVSANCYGDADEYHKRFPHGELAAILRERRNWTLSYCDAPLIRELYPEGDFDWYPVQWAQPSRPKGKTQGNDVVITPPGQFKKLSI